MEIGQLETESATFWDTLIELIEERKVVPVIGQDLLTLKQPAGSEFLYSYLAKELAHHLSISPIDLPLGDELNQVCYRYLAAGNQIEDLYPALKVIARRTEALSVPEPLLQLADIEPLTLLVSTTFDNLLARAVNDRRFGGLNETKILAYSPSEVQDLPGDMSGDKSTIVYHLLGRVSATPVFAVTQEDTLEFFHSLQSETRRPRLLFDELNRKSVLFLGCRFSGWLARFFMRMPKAQRLSAGGKSDYFVDTEASNDRNLVLFLKHFCKATKIFASGNPTLLFRNCIDAGCSNTRQRLPLQAEAMEDTRPMRTSARVSSF